MNVKKNPILAADLLTHETGQFKWRMGVRPLNLNNWLIVDDERGADLHEIRNLIDSRRNQVVYSEPDAASACQELFEEIHFHLKERTGFVNLEVEGRSDRPAIESARRIVQEDLCVLQKRPAGWTMTACAVAIPTQWHVPSKFGETLDDIHGPVPRYGVDLSRPMGIFFDRLRPEKSVWRSNFTLTDDPNLRLIPNRRNHPLLHNVTKDNVADQVLLRVEYQTLRRLPKSDAIVFTIRILRQKIRSVAANPPALASLLRTAFNFPSEVASYKDSTRRYAELVSEWALSNGLIEDSDIH